MTETLTRPPHASFAARIQGYAEAIAMVALSNLVALWIAPRCGAVPIDMIYMPAVRAAAALWELARVCWPALQQRSPTRDRAKRSLRG